MITATPQTQGQDLVKFYQHVFEVTLFLWIPFTSAVWMYSLNVVALQENTKTEQRQAYGTPYIDFAGYELTVPIRDLEKIEGYRRYWVEYHAQTGSAQWYVGFGIIFLSFHFLANYMDKKTKNPISLRVIFWAVPFLLAMHLILTAEFLHWAAG